jgi:hypothetical protein
MAGESSKISASLVARLDNMADGETISVIVLIRPSRHKRLETVDGNREGPMILLEEETSKISHEIDQVLTSYGGRRLEAVNLLGAVPVIATAPAVGAMAHIASVHSIIEDQPLRGLFLEMVPSTGGMRYSDGGGLTAAAEQARQGAGATGGRGDDPGQGSATGRSRGSSGCRR